MRKRLTVLEGYAWSACGSFLVRRSWIRNWCAKLGRAIASDISRKHGRRPRRVRVDPSGTADKALRQFPGPLERVNNDPHFLGKVTKVVLFGGMLKPKVERLSDVDASHYRSLANFLVGLNRLEEAGRILHESQERKLDSYIFHVALYAIAFLGGDSAAMTREQLWFAARPDMAMVGLSLESDNGSVRRTAGSGAKSDQTVGGRRRTRGQQRERRDLVGKCGAARSGFW